MADIELKINSTPQTDASGTDPLIDTALDDQMQEELSLRFNLLPEDVQRVLMDESYESKLFAIAKDHKLTYEQLTSLELETTMALIGLTKISEFKDQLQTELKLNDPVLAPLFKDLQEKILKNIWPSLEKLEQGVETPTTEKEEHTPIIPIPHPSGMTQEENAVLTSSGVELTDSDKASAEAPPLVPPTITDRDKVRNEMLKDLEHSSGISLDVSRIPSPKTTSTPPRTIPATPSIIADKLSQSGPVLPKTSTDYSIPKPPLSSVLPPPPARSVDPYREPVE